MLILVDHAVADSVKEFFTPLRVIYLPHLIDEGQEALGRVLEQSCPDVLITRMNLTENVAAAWRLTARQRPLIVVTITSETEKRPDLEALGITCRTVGEESTGGSLSRAFAVAERTWIEEITARASVYRSTRARTSASQSILLVGAGIVNIFTGWHLAEQGYEITLYDRSPDPRGGDSWTTHGCTWGGDNARMFTLTEADGYSNERYLPMGRPAAPFDLPVSEGGWRIGEPSTLSSADLIWLEQYASVPPWLARSYAEDILLFNHRAGELWREMTSSNPWLFGGIGLRQDILRLYSDVEHFHAQVARQERVRAIRRVLTPGDVGERHPALRSSCANGTIVGGIEVLGFTVEVHNFMKRLLDRLEEAGAQLHWNCPVSGIHWTEGGVPAGLVVAGDIVRSDAYVLSPGAYGRELLRGTASYGLIQGVLGAWLTTPNLPPRLEKSLKIARIGHRAEDTNVTVANDQSGNPVLIFGSGYGWTGSNPANIAADELESLYQAVEETIFRFFPRLHASAHESGLLDASRRFCVRPWTPTSLGVFEMMQTERDGVLIITGGHNTGGFAQAPIIAEAVLAALRGERHPMHGLYHPERFRHCLR